MENENKKINHIAIAVPDIKEAALKWQKALNCLLYTSDAADE